MWTKSQKISAAVLGLAVVAFGVDRYVLPSGDSAAASAATTSSPAKRSVSAAKRPSDNATAAATPAGAAMTLANRLAAFGDARGFFNAPTGDAFRPYEEWLAMGRPKEDKKPDPTKPATTTAKAVAPKVNHAANFVNNHHLTAVMKKHDGGMAIIDGKLYKAGQLIDGFKLTAVGLSDATFIGHGTTVTLKLPNTPAK